MIPLEGDEGIRFLVDKGYSDQEIIDVLLPDPNRPGAMHDRRELLEAAQRVRATVYGHRRARLVPDPLAAIQRAVGELREDGLRLTWQNAATWMRANIPGCESLDLKTLRTWRDDDHLPDDLADPRYRLPPI